MRLLAVLVPPLLIALPFAACVAGPAGSASDGGVDAYIPVTNDVSDDFDFDIPVVSETGPVTRCKLSGDADPVGLCVQKSALETLHQFAFAPGKGAAASWSSVTGTPDNNEAGVVSYSLDDTIAYAAAASSYLASAQLYADTTIDGIMASDLQAVALRLETSFSVNPTEYSGELYFHLRTIAQGLRAIQLNNDADKFDTLAETYGRAIYSAHYVSLGFLAPASVGDDGGAGEDAGHDGGHDADRDGSADAETGDAGATTDARTPEDGRSDAHGDAHASTDAHAITDAHAPTDAHASSGPVADGIIGNLSSDGQIAYAPADVATAAYALLDEVNRNRTSPLAPTWLAAATASLHHLRARAVEPTTGMFYTALIATKDDGGGGAQDMLAPSTSTTLPNDALLADTQATVALALVRAQYLVTSNTQVTIVNGKDAGGNMLPPLEDGGVSGPFLSVLDVPFEAWADDTIDAMNGVHTLWDVMGGGYMDAYIPSTGALVTTKSTRPNAFMAGAIARAQVNTDPIVSQQLQPLVQLLIAQASVTVPLNSNLITVLPSQVAFVRGATRAFLPLSSGPNPTSYTTSAVATAVEGLTEQFFSKSMQ